MHSLVEQVKRARDLAEVQYVEGELDLLSVLQLQDQLTEAKIQWFKLRYGSYRNRINLQLALGGRFEDKNHWENLERDTP